jgi:hypothetical protein
MTLAERIIRACGPWVPPHLRPWNEAMAREAAEVDRPGAALVFALGCAAWAARVGLAQSLQEALSSDGPRTGETSTMAVRDLWEGRGLALLCAIAATGLGLVYLGLAGAPVQMLTMNLAALIAGLVIVGSFHAREPISRPLAGILAVSVGAALLFVALVGDQASGVRRWVAVGPIVVQPSLILLPLLIVGFARFRTVLTAGGVILAAIALALQPDRAMAGALVASLAAISLVARDKKSLVCLGVATVGFAVTLMTPDVVPPTLFVDRVFRTAFSTHAVAGFAVWTGAVALLLPGAVGALLGRRDRAAFAGFGACWAAVVVAAILGDYPTPLVGYSGSAIFGYVLATLGLPRIGSRSPRAEASPARPSTATERPDAHTLAAS